LEKSRRCGNRIAVAVDVTALSVLLPVRRQKLHRSLRSRNTRAADSAEFGFDEVHRRKVLPWHTGFRLRILIRGTQLLLGRGFYDAPPRQFGLAFGYLPKRDRRVDLRRDDALRFGSSSPASTGSLSAGLSTIACIASWCPTPD
jgi:hypothetical protein